MRKFFTLLLTVGTLVSASPITYTYDNLNKSKKTCRITGWSGSEPTSGVLAIKGTYTTDNVTYTVTEIAPHALDNLSGTTQITIPAGVTQIGDIDAVSPTKGAKSASLHNFNGCSRLTKFVVEDGNTVFTANSDGWLMSKDGRNLYRVPASAKCSDGELKMSNYIHYIFADAFVGNSKVTKVTLSAGLQSFYTTCGLCKLSNVTEYAVSSSSTILKTVNGVLLNAKGSVLYCYPPAKDGEAYTVPASVKTIAAYAFANNHTLRIVNHSSVTKLQKSAFENATYLYTFSGTAPSTVETRAFYNAINLSAFPFSGFTALEGDSIFFGNGFGSVTFDDDIFIPTTTPDRFTFSDDRLGVLNMSKMVFGSDNAQDVYPFYSDFASGCHKLVKISLPKRCIFKKDLGRAAFYGPFNLQYIETGSFRVEDGNVPFVFPVYNSTSNTLRIITATNSSTADIDKYAEWGSLVSTSGTGGISPVIYTDMRAPYAANAQSNYVYRTNKGYATYYVPGLCADNYKEAKNEYCPVHEMYTLSVAAKDGRAVVSLKSNETFVRLSSISVNGAESIKVSSDGEYDTNVAIDDLQTVRVSYSLYFTSPYHTGPAMSTTYTRQDFGLAGADDITMDADSEAPVQYYDLRGLRISEPTHGIFIRRQGASVSKVAIP